MEIRKNLSESPIGKSPGPDGLTTEYYRKFSDILVPRMCAYMNGIGMNWDIRREALEAAITIIPKDGKDPSLCSSYRPISLLNADVELFARILAGRMKNIMNKLVYNDQVGFIPCRESRDNSIKTLLLIQRIKEGKSPGLLLSIDAEKAFDRVDWGYLQTTLEFFGVGPKMLGWIKALYNHPTARVKVNGTVTGLFEMFNGTRQGCPLSPLLFILS